MCVARVGYNHFKPQSSFSGISFSKATKHQYIMPCCTLRYLAMGKILSPVFLPLINLI